MSGICHQCTLENLHNCWNHSVLFLQQISGCLNFPITTRAWECDVPSSYLKNTSATTSSWSGGLQQLPPATATPLVCLLISSQILASSLPIGKDVLHLVLQLLSHIKSNSFSSPPSCSVLELVSTRCSTLVVCAVTPHFLEPSEVVPLCLHTDLKLLLFGLRTTCIRGFSANVLGLHGKVLVTG